MNSTKMKVNKIIKRLILVIAAMGLVMSGVSYGYDDYIELTPVPEEMIVEIAMGDNADSKYLKAMGIDKGIDYYELIPVYNLNGDVMYYQVILFFEGTPKQTWMEILESLNPDYEEYKKFEDEVRELEKKIYELHKLKDITVDENERKKIHEEIIEIGERATELNRILGLEKSSDFRRRNYYYSGLYRANFEQKPGFSSGGLGIPFLFINYWRIYEFLEDEFNTNDIEFVRFVISGGRGFLAEFIVDGRNVLSSYSPIDDRIFWEYREEMKATEDFDELYKRIDPTYEDGWYELLEIYRKEEVEIDDNINTGYYLITPPGDGEWIGYHPDYTKTDYINEYGGCSHVASSNLLAYHNYQGFELVPEDKPTYWDWEYDPWIITYRHNNDYGHQFQRWTYEYDYNANPTVLLMAQIINAFTVECGYDTPGQEEFNVEIYEFPDDTWGEMVDEIEGIPGDFDNPVCPVWLATLSRYIYNEDHAVTIVGYDSTGNPKTIWIYDNWYSDIDQPYEIEWSDFEPIITVTPDIEPAIQGSVYFAGTSGPDYIELGLCAECDATPTHWRLYRSRHRTGPFTTEPGVLVEDFWTYPEEQEGDFWLQRYRTQDNTMDDCDGYWTVRC